MNKYKQVYKITKYRQILKKKGTSYVNQVFKDNYNKFLYYNR